jgi:hypothetical protein
MKGTCCRSTFGFRDVRICLRSARAPMPLAAIGTRPLGVGNAPDLGGTVDEEVRRVVSLGARAVRTEGELVVMADPEGNEFWSSEASASGTRGDEGANPEGRRPRVA